MGKIFNIIIAKHDEICLNISNKASQEILDRELAQIQLSTSLSVFASGLKMQDLKKKTQK